MTINDEFIVIAFAVIDTNVIISSLIGNKETATKNIIEMVKHGNIIPLFDTRMLDEYYEIISRFYDEEETLLEVEFTEALTVVLLSLLLFDVRL